MTLDVTHSYVPSQLTTSSSTPSETPDRKLYWIARRIGSWITIEVVTMLSAAIAKQQCWKSR